MKNSFTFFGKVLANSLFTLVLLCINPKSKVVSIFIAFALVLSNVPILLYTLTCRSKFFKTTMHKVFITITLLLEYLLLFLFYKQFEQSRLVDNLMIFHLVISACLSCMHYFFYGKYNSE